MMSITTLTAEQIDNITTDDLMGILGIDLREHSWHRADAGHTAQWIEASEQKTWDLPTFGLRVGNDRLIMWTLTDEAGIADETIVDAEDDIEAQVREYAEEIASGLGDLVTA
jgi:hypothetical protein